MSLIKVKEYLKQFNMDNRILEFNESSATVLLAAERLGCNPDQIAKTLSFDVDGKVILIVTSGLSRIDNQKFKEYFHTKANMLKHDDVELLVGHPAGGVCPFGINDGVTVYLDESLKKYATVFPACGSANSAIEISIEELEKTSNYKSWIDVAKVIE